MSFIDLQNIVNGTSMGFLVAYGLFSIKNVPFFSERVAFAYLSIMMFVIFFGVILFKLLKSKVINDSVDREISRLDEASFTALLVSASIFVISFFVFTNWAYRLIFLIPAFLIASTMVSEFSKVVCLNILLIFWLPIMPYGWGLQNLACFPLVVMLAYLIIRGLFHVPVLKRV